MAAYSGCLIGSPSCLPPPLPPPPVQQRLLLSKESAYFSAAALAVHPVWAGLRPGVHERDLV